MGERETWKCPMPDDVCEQCGYRCSAPAPAEAVAWMIRHRVEPNWQPIVIVGAMDPREVHDMGERFEYIPLARLATLHHASPPETVVPLLDAYEELASHLSHCRTCAEESEESCFAAQECRAKVATLRAHPAPARGEAVTEEVEEVEPLVNRIGEISNRLGNEIDESLWDVDAELRARNMDPVSGLIVAAHQLLSMACDGLPPDLKSSTPPTSPAALVRALARPDRERDQ